MITNGPPLKINGFFDEIFPSENLKMVPNSEGKKRSFSRFLPPEKSELFFTQVTSMFFFQFRACEGAADASDCSLLVAILMAIQFDGERFVGRKYRIPKSLGKR